MSWADFHFIRPYWLLALIPAAIVVTLLLRKKLSRGNWATVCDPELLPFLLQEKALSYSRWPIAVGSAATLLVILALAGPTWKRIPSPVFRNDAALVIALDLSRSMDAQDVAPSRLTRARYKIADILKKRKDGQTALLVYAGDAFTVTPLTDDTNTIDSQLSALTTDIMPSQGSNTELVLKRAVEMFRRAGLTRGEILLVTDSVDLDETLSTAKALGKYHLSILGVGTPDGAPIPVAEGGFLKDDQGNIVLPKLNPADLEKLAGYGHGIYRTITANDADIEAFLNSFDRTLHEQGIENSNLMLDQWDEFGPWLLLAVLPLAALLFRRGLLCIGLCFLLPFPQNSYALDLWHTQNQKAYQAFQNKDYQNAAANFNTPEWQAAALYKAGQYAQAAEKLADRTDPESLYNRGNALAQAGQLQEAMQAYQQVLAQHPDHADARYNKEVVENELKKQQQQQNQSGQQGQNKPQQDRQEQQDNKNQQAQDSGSDQQQSSEAADQEQNADPKEQPPQQDNAEKPAEAQPAPPAQPQPEPVKEQQQQEESAKAAEAEQQDQKAKDTATAMPETKPKDETTQANEQWLNRIPDDPAGLLKRKFEYQYKYEYQRKQQHRAAKEAW